MKKVLLLSAFALTFLLTGCQGSDAYAGSWKALNGEGLKSEIIFTSTEMTINSADSSTASWRYSQHTVEIENGINKYGIRLENGLRYTIVLTSMETEDAGIIMDQNERILFVIGRSEYRTYEEVFGL